MATQTLLGNLGTIISAGVDAMSNLYDVIIYPPSNLTSNSSDFGKNYQNIHRIRIGDFTPPVLSVNEVEVHYKTESFFVPGQIIEGERELSIPFRVDANFSLYNDLIAWRDMFYSPANGQVGRPLVAGDFGQIIVVANKRVTSPENYALDFRTFSASDLKRTDVVYWSFTEVWLSSVENPEFSREDATPIKGTAKFQFGHMTYVNNPPAS